MDDQRGRVGITAADQRNAIIYQTAEELKVSRLEATRLLCQMYQLDRLDLIIDSIKRNYNQGLRPKQITQLKILHAYLSILLEKMGFDDDFI